MSVVTNVMLTGLGVKSGTAYVELQRWLSEKELPEFEEISQHAGGPRYMELDVLACAFNWISDDDLAAMMHVMASLDWRSPETLQLMINTQHEFKFTIYECDWETKKWYKTNDRDHDS